MYILDVLSLVMIAILHNIMQQSPLVNTQKCSLNEKFGHRCSQCVTFMGRAFTDVRFELTQSHYIV